MLINLIVKVKYFKFKQTLSGTKITQRKDIVQISFVQGEKTQPFSFGFLL